MQYDLTIDNPRDRQELMIRKHLLMIVPRLIMSRGTLVEVLRGTEEYKTDEIYGVYSGQKHVELLGIETRVLGLPLFEELNVNNGVGEMLGQFVGSDQCFVFADSGIQNNDILRIPNTKTQFVVTEPQRYGSKETLLLQFKVSSLLHV